MTDTDMEQYYLTLDAAEGENEGEPKARHSVREKRKYGGKYKGARHSS